MSLTCGALTLERNASRKNQITLHDDVEAENEPRPRDTCMSYQDWFVAEMKAVEKELMKGDVVEVAKRFGLGTIIARPISAINLELDADRIDDALPVIAEPELLSKCSLKDSSNVTRQDKRIPVYYVSPLWPLLPQKYQPPEGFVLPFGPLKERVLDYLIEMAQDSLDKSKPIPFPPPSLLNLEKGKVFQPKSALKVSSTVSPRSKKLVASGKNDLGLSDQGEDVGETVLMTVSEEVCQSINSPTDHIQGIPLFDERQKSNNHIHQLAREVRQSLKEDKAPENGTLLTLPASYDVQLDPINPIYQLAKEIQQSLKEEGAAPENNTLLTVPASHDVQLDPTNPIYQLAKEVQQRLKEEEEAPEKNTLLTIPASHDVQLDPTNPIYQLAKEVQQSLKKEEAAPEKKTVPASHDVQLEPLNPIYQLSEEVRQSMNGEEAQRNNPLLANTASDDVMLESVLIYQLAREVQQSLMDEKAPENETLPTIIDDSNDVQLESMNPIYQLAFEVCQGLKDEEAQENDTLLTTPFFDNVQLESTDQIFKLAKEVRQSLKIKEAPDNETPLATLATNDDAIPRLDYSNNFLVHHARDFSHHDSTNSPLISTVENSPSTTFILLENEADINIIQKLAREVEEEIERALRASPQKPLALFASSKQQDLNNDKQLSGKPTDEEQSHAASKSQNETIYSGDEVEELYHLKSEELEIQLNKLKKTTETSGSALPSSSGDSCRRGPLAATWRQSSFDVTCRPGYRGISHRATPTPSVKCVFMSGAKAPNKSSSIKRSLIGPLPPAYPGREYTRSGYRGR